MPLGAGDPPAPFQVGRYLSHTLLRPPVNSPFQLFLIMFLVMPLLSQLSAGLSAQSQNGKRKGLFIAVIQERCVESVHK